FDVRVAGVGAEIPTRQRATIAFEIRRLDRDDRPLDAHVLVRRGLGLHAEADPARPLEQPSLPRRPSGDEPELAGLVGVPARDGEWPPPLLRDAEDADVHVAQKALTLLPRHRERHG